MNNEERKEVETFWKHMRELMGQLRGKKEDDG